MNRRGSVLAFVAALTAIHVGCSVGAPPLLEPAAVSCVAPHGKACGNQCVDRRDVAFGCGAESCAPCVVAHAALIVCGAQGTCVADKCSARWGNCNGEANDGCETDLLSPNTCGSCSVRCADSESCSTRGCGACVAPEEACDRSCVDKRNDELHCGHCDIVCPTPAHGKPQCIASTCRVKCDDGYLQCTKDGPCELAVPFFRDLDGDTWGGASAGSGCANAVPLGAVLRGGDCNDAERNAFPGQTAFFGTPYGASNGGTSFDYDCDGVELGGPGQAAGVCASGPVASSAGCSPGYTKTARNGAGVNPLCGSAQGYACDGSAPPCTTRPLSPYACR